MRGAIADSHTCSGNPCLELATKILTFIVIYWNFFGLVQIKSDHCKSMSLWKEIITINPKQYHQLRSLQSGFYKPNHSQYNSARRDLVCPRKPEYHLRYLLHHYVSLQKLFVLLCKVSESQVGFRVQLQLYINLSAIFAML